MKRFGSIFCAIGFSLCAIVSPSAQTLDLGGDENIQASQERVKKSKLKKSEKEKGRLSFSGRVFARDVLSKVDFAGAPTTHERSVDSARLAIVYKRKWLSMQIEFDVAGGDADLNDGYIRIQPNKNWRFVAGRFKRPMGMLTLSSKWELPSTERGLLSTVRLGADRERLPFTRTRGDGLMLRYKKKFANKKKIYATVALVQNGLGDDEDLLLSAADFGQDVYGRIAFKWNKDIEVASSVALFPYLEDFSGPDALNHGVVVSAEARVDKKFFSVIVTGFTGTNLLAPFTLTPQAQGNVRAAQALITGYLSRESKPKRIEPFLLLSYLDPSSEATNDVLTEWGGGINIRVVKDWRLTLDYLQTSAQGNNSPCHWAKNRDFTSGWEIQKHRV